MFCEKCGSRLPEGSKFCMNCGAKAITEETIQNTAVQEAAVSADTTVIEAEPEKIEEETAAIPEVQPAPQQEAAQSATAQNFKSQAAVPINTAAPQSFASMATPQNFANTATIQSSANTAAIQSTQSPAAPQNIRQSAASAQRAAIPQQTSSFQSAASFQPAEADLKPEKIKPLQTWKFAGMLIITAIPVINLIMVLIWSFSGGFNKNTRSYARATLILWIAGLVLLIIATILNWALIQYIWSEFSSVPANMPPLN